MKTLPPRTALLVVDMQIGFDDLAWGPRNNPALERNVAALIAAWRAAECLLVHVHHDSPHAAGRLRPGTPGNAVKPEARPLGHEPVIRKTVNSAFIGTGLETVLIQMGVRALAVVGLTTNHCISTTVRMAANLGFETFVAVDATAAFDRAGLNGEVRPAEDVHSAALSDLHDEFAQIVDTRWLIAALAASKDDPAGRPDITSISGARHV